MTLIQSQSAWQTYHFEPHLHEAHTSESLSQPYHLHSHELQIYDSLVPATIAAIVLLIISMRMVFHRRDGPGRTN